MADEIPKGSSAYAHQIVHGGNDVGFQRDLMMLGPAISGHLAGERPFVMRLWSFEANRERFNRLLHEAAT